MHISVGVPLGYRIADVSYGRWSLGEKSAVSDHYAYWTVILHEVRYPATVKIQTAPEYRTRYCAGEGTGEEIAVSEDSPRLFPNTLAWDHQFVKEGCLAVGWNTAPDGSGTRVGFGSQPHRTPGEELVLYPEFLSCSPEDSFTWREESGSAVITGWSGAGDLVIPETLGGLPVSTLAAGAFGDVSADTVAFPATLEAIEAGAFRALSADTLIFFDSLTEVSDASFGRFSVRSLRIQAATAPVYCGTYFDTLSEKYAYLSTLRGQKKLLLFCGSSARFGYNSPLLESAFPEYRVANLGVYAYANMLPQAMLLLQYAEPGDLLLTSPDLDAIDKQFCAGTALDKETFYMAESNYDLLASLDLTGFTHIWEDYAAYQAARRFMESKAYSNVPSQYDEDGNRVREASYNRYGDYILPRENNEARVSFGVKRASFNAAYITDADWDGFNRVLDAFAAKGVQPLFTWSPRSSISLTEDSTEASIAELERIAQEKLHAVFLTPIQDAILDPYWFYATDNHLSTEGAERRTEAVIAAL